METREAFEVIKSKLKADPRKRYIESFFDERVFGNFWITYEDDGEHMSIVNDRGQLVLFEGSTSDRFRAMLVDDLRSASHEAVLSAVS